MPTHDIEGRLSTNHCAAWGLTLGNLMSIKKVEVTLGNLMSIKKVEVVGVN